MIIRRITLKWIPMAIDLVYIMQLKKNNSLSFINILSFLMLINIFNFTQNTNIKSISKKLSREL